MINLLVDYYERYLQLVVGDFLLLKRRKCLRGQFSLLCPSVCIKSVLGDGLALCTQQPTHFSMIPDAY